jgi:putative phage-type endonuclease
MQQGTDEWRLARCGWVGASNIAAVMSKGRSGAESATRNNYKAQVVAEILSGLPLDSFNSSAMQWGTENEPFARAAYEVKTGLLVDQVGFVPHPDIFRTGASPDGLIGNDGLIEIKCPNTATHISYAVTGKIPSEYQYQMLWQMEVTGRKWCDFASFDPRMPESMQLYVQRFERDDARIAEIKAAVIEFLKECEESCASLKRVFGDVK